MYICARASLVAALVAVLALHHRTAADAPAGLDSEDGITVAQTDNAAPKTKALPSH
ncbi:hypothetical protein ACFYXF_00225 [Streptomyces sp. NPDC002680]|uniref:hypothetical protein n=1 Tax=Streptomyces sp. NPDC002680 TaxID=3364659 RepID=UPI00369C4872